MAAHRHRSGGWSPTLGDLALLAAVALVLALSWVGAGGSGMASLGQAARAAVLRQVGASGGHPTSEITTGESPASGPPG